MTISLGVLFLFIQNIEYFILEILWSDRVYGSIFFITTGFHGLHVIIGLIFLLKTYINIIKINSIIFEIAA